MLRAAYDQLLLDIPGEAVIVRSSATLEDTASASFAGMNRPLANVHGFSAMVEAIKACWASQFAPRSVSYRLQRGFPVADATIAVVVQRYLPASRSGMIFTADPTTGNRDRMVIEASVGGGGALVSGRVTPDRFVIDARAGRIVARTIERKELRVDDVAAGGIAEHLLTDDEGTAPAISDAEALQLFELGRRIEDHFGAPEDVEWLIDDDDAVWIVQSRPITTLTPRTGDDTTRRTSPANSDWRRRSAARLRRCTPSTRRCSCARVSTRSRSAPTPSSAPHTSSPARSTR